MARPRLSDGYFALLVAIGPGLVACALLALAEFGAAWFLPVDFLAYYAIAGLAFLPGLPAFAACLGRAIPGRRPAPNLAWLLLSPVALVWHIIVTDGCYRWWWHGRSPIDWGLVLRYAACLWLATTLSWAALVRHSVRQRSRIGGATPWPG
jgi:hypothetical protein